MSSRTTTSETWSRPIAAGWLSRPQAAPMATTTRRAGQSAAYGAAAAQWAIHSGGAGAASRFTPRSADLIAGSATRARSHRSKRINAAASAATRTITLMTTAGIPDESRVIAAIRTATSIHRLCRGGAHLAAPAQIHSDVDRFTYLLCGVHPALLGPGSRYQLRDHRPGQPALVANLFDGEQTVRPGVSPPARDANRDHFVLSCHCFKGTAGSTE